MKMNSRKLLSMLLALAMILSMFTVTASAAKAPSLSKSLVSVELGKTTSLKVSNATSTVSWSTSDPSIATVSGGTVTAKGVGSAVITAKCGTYSMNCKVNVYGAEFNPSELTLAVGESKTVKATLLGQAATIKSATSGNTRIATVTKAGVVKALRPGSTVIKFKINKAEYEIPVTVIRDHSVNISWDVDFKALEEMLNNSILAEKYNFLGICNAFDVTLVDQDGNEIDTPLEETVTVHDIWPDHTSGLRLFRIHNGKTNEIPYTYNSEDGSITFTTDQFSPFILAYTRSVKAVPVEFHAIPCTDSILTVYANDMLFRSADYYSAWEDFYFMVEYSDGTEEEVWMNVDMDKYYAPAEPGPFDVTVSWTAPDGTVLEDVLHLTALKPEHIISSYLFKNAGGYAGSVNNKSIKTVVFTDEVIPANENIARKYEIGQEARSSVIAYRLNGQEDVLYVSSGEPGVYPVYDGGSLFTGYVTEIDARKLDTSRSDHMPRFTANNGAFQNGVQKINYSGCDFSGVTSLASAFNSYTGLKYLDLSNCDFSNVENMSHMCVNTPNMVEINMNGAVFGEGKLKNTEYAFAQCGAEKIDLGGLETSNVTIAQGMFKECKNLKYLDMSGCDFTNLKTAPYMFERCESLETLLFNESGMPNLEGSLRQMFDCCTHLVNVDMSGINFANVTNLFRTFCACYNLQTTLNIDASNIDIENGGYNADMATGDNASVIINCTQASKDILEQLIRKTNVQYTMHIIYNVTDSDIAIS